MHWTRSAVLAAIIFLGCGGPGNSTGGGGGGGGGSAAGGGTSGVGGGSGSTGGGDVGGGSASTGGGGDVGGGSASTGGGSAATGGGSAATGGGSGAVGGGTGAGGGVTGDGGTIHITGSAAKGPFITGVTVSVQGLNPTTLNPVAGTQVSGQTMDNAGQFALDVTPGLSQIHVNGQFYQEISGTVSTAAQDLFGIVDLQSSGSATVNLVTHLTSQRIKNLMLSGKTYSQAVTQAESELETAMAVGADPGVPGAQMSFLSGDTLPSAYVFAMSSIFDREAKIAGNTTSLQEQINTVETDLASNGMIDSTTSALLKRGEVCVRPSDVMDKLQTRFNTIGSSATVPNINRALDSDLDGVPNLTDNCLRAANANQAAVTDQVCASSVDTTAQTATTVTNVQLIRAGDLTGDGRPDVVVLAAGNTTSSTSPTPEGLITWVSQADGGYSSPTTVSLLTLASAPYNLTPLEARIGDVSGDGKADVVISYVLFDSMFHPTGPKLGYLPGDGAGNFGPIVDIYTPIDPASCNGTYCTQQQVCNGTSCITNCSFNPMSCNQQSGACNPTTGLCQCGTKPACSGGTPYCINGNCSSTPPCSPGSCSNGNQCDQTSGQCKCGSTVCSGQTTCSNGTCQPNCGAGGPCQTGQLCSASGTCVPACGNQACDSNPTDGGMGQFCDFGTLMCVSTCAGGIGNRCNFGQYCLNGTCTSTGICGSSPSAGPCPAGYGCDMQKQQCSPYCSGMTICTNNTICSNGNCVQSCQFTGCSNNNTCTNGVCQCGGTTACAGTTSCVNNTSCQMTCGPGNQVCPSGTTCNGMSCICGNNNFCQSNQSCIGGSCVNNCGSGGPCAAGQVCSSAGACVAAPLGGAVDFDLRDINGDGRLDIVSSGFGGTYNAMQGGITFSATRQAQVGVFLGKMGGGFNAPIVSSLSQTSVDAVDVTIADLDKTNGLDVVISLRAYTPNTNSDTWTIVALLNDGAGHLAPPSSASAVLAGPFSGRVVAHAGDVDHDGNVDLALLSGVQPTFPTMTYTPALSVVFGDGTGHFANPLSVAVNQMLTGTYAYTDCPDATPSAMGFTSMVGELGLGDLNGDGKADLFTSDRVYLSTGRAVGAPGRLEGAGGGAGKGGMSGGPNGGQLLTPAASGPVVIDLDGDGKAEVLSPSLVTDSMGMNPKASLLVGHVNPPNVHTW